eukprot:scaffold72990_cov33-Attheya_sp.AAC.1
MAIAPSELRTVGEGDAMCATTGNAFRGVSMLIVRIATRKNIKFTCTGTECYARLPGEFMLFEHSPAIGALEGVEV